MPPRTPPARRAERATHGPLLACLLLVASCAPTPPAPVAPGAIVLGIAQDGGVPQTGALAEPGWTDPARRRHVACLGLIDAGGQRWMIDATPDFPRQLWSLNQAAPTSQAPAVSGIFLTHAHVGHYTGLMFLGHESMGAAGIPVYAMPRMSDFLRTSGPWSQLVRLQNIELRPLEAGAPVRLPGGLTITPIPVPHRQEFSEVVGFRIAGPRRSILFIPDIDSWDQWDASGVRLEDELAKVDAAYLDGTFYSNGEIPGRDMSGFPHPFITRTMERLRPLPRAQRDKVRFIHLNHTNPALWEGTPQRREIESRGFHVAREGERLGL